jgi:hypothetical protein
MTGNDAASAYKELSFDLKVEDGVTVVENELLVHGAVFAFLDGDDLVVELPEQRATDLASRSVARRFASHHHPTRNWIRVADRELWPELARESHTFVSDPAVGGES